MGAGKDSRRGAARWGINGTDARLGAATAALGSGLIHLQLGLVTAPDHGRDGLGRLFVAYGIVAVLGAVALVVRRDAFVRAGVAGLLAAALVVLATSRAGLDVYGSSSTGLAPAPQAPLAIMCAVVGLGLLALTFVSWVGPGEVFGRRATSGVVAAAVAIAGFGTLTWSQGDDAVQAIETSGAPETPDRTDPAAGAARSSVTATTAPSDPPAFTPVATVEITPTTDPPASTTEPPPTTEPPAATSAPATTTTEPATTTTEPATTTLAPTTTRPPETVRLRIGDYGFDPDLLEVRAGTTVEWWLDGSRDHSVVAVDGSFDSGPLTRRGVTFSHTFTTPGLYPYRNGIQVDLDGVIVVNA